MPPNKTEAKTIDGLVGRSFHVFGDNGTVERQGTVIAQVGLEHYLVQYFEWMLGSENTLAVVSLSDMACSPKNERTPWSWQFYKDDVQMNDWYQQHADCLKRKAEAKSNRKS